MGYSGFIWTVRAIRHFAIHDLNGLDCGTARGKAWTPLWHGARLLLGLTMVATLTVAGAAQTVTTTASTNGSVLGIGVNPATNKVYAANFGTNSVTVYNANTETTSTLAIGANPSGVAVNLVTDRIYVTSTLGVTVIDGCSHSSSPVPGTPAGTYNIVLVGTGSDGLQRNLDFTLTVN